jgi:hypothetical protein
VNHDLRRVVRTKLSDFDVDDVVAEMVLGHGAKASRECMTEQSACHKSGQRSPSGIAGWSSWRGMLDSLRRPPVVPQASWSSQRPRVWY